MNIDYIEHTLGLHNYIEISYEVDQYRVELFQYDGQSVKYSATGETILEALSNLNEKIKSGY